MGKVKAQLDDMPIEFGDEGIPEWKMKKDMDEAYKMGQEKLKEKSKIVKEIEYYSDCCDAPPYNYNEVDICNDNTGYCMKCGSGTPFYIQKSEDEPSMDKIWGLLDKATEIEKEVKGGK